MKRGTLARCLLAYMIDAGTIYAARPTDVARPVELWLGLVPKR